MVSIRVNHFLTKHSFSQEDGMDEINVDQIMKKHGNNAFWILRALYDIMDFPNISFERSIEYSNSGAKNILDHAMAHVMDPNMKSRYWTSSVPE